MILLLLLLFYLMLLKKNFFSDNGLFCFGDFFNDRAGEKHFFFSIAFFLTQI